MSPACDKKLGKIICGFKNTSSTGLDEFSSIIVKHCQEELFKPLNYITNLSLSQGVFPKR